MPELPTNFVFSDAEWQSIKELSGLSDDFRIHVENVVSFLRDKPSLKHAFVTETQRARDDIRKVREGLESVLPHVKRLLHSGAHFVFHPLPIGRDNDARAIGSKRGIAQLHDLMERVRGDLEYSEGQLPYGSAGRTTAHLTEAVRMLNKIIFDATGQSLNQKKKDQSGVELSEFVLQVCQKAYPTLRFETVVNQIKRLQSLSRRKGGRARRSR